MNKNPTRISLLSLLINLEGHHNLLLRILNEAHVTQDITVEKFEGIWRATYPSEEEIPTEGRGYNQPLHISIKCSDYTIARILIDNGSSLNVLPKIMLDKLCSTSSQLRASSIIVRAFDRSKREVMGEVTLPIRIGPTTFNITFQCLLGRPWIHSIGVVPSSLHQKVKFIAGQQLISIMGEKELLISTLPLSSQIHQRGQRGPRDLLSVARGHKRNQHWTEKPRPFQSRNHGCLDGNNILMCDNPSEPDKPVKDERMEVEALVEMERWIGHEKPKFQPLAEELEWHQSRR
ncbi:hypothetical protein CR513_51020, partial [Mucuna pruriens]